MSFPTRSLSTHMRAASASASTASQSPALVARIEEKKAELENLKDLRDLSAAVAGQMEALEHKLQTLSDGTEGTYFGFFPRRETLTESMQLSRPSWVTGIMCYEPSTWPLVRPLPLVLAGLVD